MAGIRKLLIANRGEIALRIIRTCKELGIRTIAVFSDADRATPHVLAADEAYHIGASPSRDSYLRMDLIIDVAGRARADAVHPGYGFLAENAEFAQRVIDAGLIFVGPRPSSIRAMGDKTEARKLVSAAGVPIVPGTPGPVAAVEEARTFCGDHGYPVLLKAAAGGGGKGMRIVRGEAELQGAFAAAQSEALSAFGDPRVYVEKYLDSPRHIEFQILADAHGHTLHLGERECSIQRRHQKVIEESPSAMVDEEMRRRMGQTAVNAARACAYENAGTIEFLVDRDGKFYFLEMNTRLQVEHPVTELRTGIDIVAAQLLIAAGDPLAFTQEELQFRGHAIECRVCAEDVENEFFPDTGTITHLKSSQGPGVREDRGVDQGGDITVYYDSMISKLLVWAPSRREAIARMRQALHEYEIVGVKTNIPLCLFVMDHPKFIEGDFDTHFIPTYFRPDVLVRTQEIDRAATAILCAVLAQERRATAVPGLRAPAEAIFGRTRRMWGDNGPGDVSSWKALRIRGMRS